MVIPQGPGPVYFPGCVELFRRAAIAQGHTSSRSAFGNARILSGISDRVNPEIQRPGEFKKGLMLALRGGLN